MSLQVRLGTAVEATFLGIRPLLSDKEQPEEGVGDLKSGDSMETIKRKVFAVTRQALGGSVPVAMDLVHKLLKLGTVATPQTDSHMQAMAAAVLGAGDLLVAVSHSGNSRHIIDALHIALIFSDKERAISSVHDTSVAAARKKL